MEARKVVVSNNLLFEEVAAHIQEGRVVEIPTKGRSMFPFIIGGEDSLRLSPITTPIEVGEILLAHIPARGYVVHRVIWREANGDGLTLMGDGNIAGREQCKTHDVVARVVAIIHNGMAVDCNSPAQRRRATLWRMLLPLRRLILAVWRRVV